MDPKELVAAAEKALQEIEALETATAEEKDAEKAKTLQADVQAKREEFDALEAKVETAVAQAERQTRLAQAKRMLTVVPPGDVGDQPEPEPQVPAQAKDHVAAERLKVQGVYDYCCGKALSGQMQQALAPRSDKFVQGAGGVALPRSIFQGIFGKLLTDKVWGKTNPLDSSGGQGVGEANLVPQEYIPQLLQLPGEPTFLLQMCTIVPTTTGTLTYPRLVQTDANEYGGVSMSWISEGTSKPETQPEFEQLEVAAHELAGHTQITHRLLSRSAISLEALLSNLFRDACYHAVDVAFLTGSGTGQPLGIINDANVRVVTRAAVNQVEWNDLVNLATALLPHHRGNGRFSLDTTVENHLMIQHEANYAAQTARTARPLFFPSVAGGPYTRLAPGYPYNVTQRTRNLGQAGDVIFGDWSKYLCAMEQDVVVKRSDHYAFLNNVATFVVYLVLGGRASLPRAFAYLSAATS